MLQEQEQEQDVEHHVINVDPPTTSSTLRYTSFTDMQRFWIVYYLAIARDRLGRTKKDVGRRVCELTRALLQDDIELKFDKLPTNITIRHLWVSASASGSMAKKKALTRNRKPKQKQQEQIDQS